MTGLVSTGRRRALTGVAGSVMTLCAAAFAVWVIYTNLFVISDPLFQGILFVSGFLALLFPVVGHAPDAPERPIFLDWMLSFLSVACGVYFAINANALQERIPYLDALTLPQFTFGTLLMLLVIEGTRRTAGLGLTGIVLLFLAYNWFGSFLPPPFGHGVSEFSSVLEALVFSTDGVFGVPIQVVASYVFLFVLFGTLLSKAGGGAFFFDVAAAATGKSRGGPAKVAVISSGLYGTISGSPTADVVTTGSITIPIMKRLGYSGRFAGAVEVAASTGGSVMPPILGSAAFILAEFTATPYRDIVAATVIPALVYYVGIYCQVHFRAINSDLKSLEGDVPRLSETLIDGWVFVLPIGAIIGMLWVGFSPVMTAGVGCLSVVLGAALTKRTRLSAWSLVEVLSETTQRILPVAGACAAAGLVIGGLSMTGLGMKSAGLIVGLSDGAIGWTLLLAAGVTILLGLGMPTPSAFILAAILVAPALVDIGLPLLESHIFLLYFAILSALTPPIAVAAMAAAAIADEDPMRIALDAVRLAAVGFMLPFVFLWNPAILGQGTEFGIFLVAVGGILGAAAIAVAIEWKTSDARRWRDRASRAGLIIGAVAAVAPNPLVSVTGILAVSALFLVLRMRSRRYEVKLIALDDPKADQHIEQHFGVSPILIQFPTVFAIFAPATHSGATLLDRCKERLPGKYYSVIVSDPKAFFELSSELPLSRFLLSDQSGGRLREFARDIEGTFLRMPVADESYDSKVVCRGQLQGLFVGGPLLEKMQLMDRLTEPMEGKLFGAEFGDYCAPIGSSCNKSGDRAGSITKLDAALAFARTRGVRLCLTQKPELGNGSQPIFGLERSGVVVLRDGPWAKEKLLLLRNWIEKSENTLSDS